MSTGYSYDNLNRLTQMQATCTSGTGCAAPNTPISSYAYTLGPSGNRLSVAELSGRSVTYGYDDLYRLTSETVASDPKGNNGQVTYTLDNVGNRLQLNSTLPAIVPTGLLSYDANDRVSTDTFDANGNTTINSGQTNVYDFENRLVQRGGVSVVYDGDGNRVKETVAGVTTSYLVADQNPTGYAQVLDVIQGGAVTRTYAYGLELINERQTIAGTLTTSFYGYDGHGSVRFLTSSTGGAITDTYDYDAFGNLISSTGSTPNNYLFAGEQFDPALGIYYNRARYYDQRQGRFWTMDTWEGDPESPSSLHRYLYASGNPADRSDPSGRVDIGDALAALSIASIIEGVASLGYHVYNAITATSQEQEHAAVVAAYEDAAGITFALVGLGGGSLGPRLAAAGYGQLAVLAGEGASLAERAGSVAASLILFASSANTGGTPRNTQNPNQVTTNKATGDAKARAFLNGLRQKGVNVVGEQIYIKTPLGDRIADRVIEVNGKYIAVEVKSGSGVRTALQFAKDMFINTFGGQAFGTAAGQSGIDGITITATRTFFIP